MLKIKSMKKRLVKRYGTVLRLFRTRLSMVVLFSVLSLTALFITLSSINVLAVSVDGQKVVIRTLNSDVYYTMEKNGIEIEPNDIVTVSENKRNIDVSITRTFPVSLRVDGAVNYQYVSGGTVGDLLNNNGIVLAGEDTVNLPAETALSSGIDVIVVRKSSKQYVQYVPIPYNTRTEKVFFGSSIGKMPADIPGSDGVRKVTKIDSIVDGVVTSTKTISNTIERQPVTAVKYVAVKAPAKLVDGKELSFSKVLTMTASAYTGGGSTAKGYKAQVGCVAINPRINKNLKHGDKLYIETTDGRFVYGYCTVNDTGGFGSGIDIDIYLPSKADCYSFGKRTVKVYVLS